MEKKETTMPI